MTAGADSREILHLTFDEGRGAVVHDAAGSLPDAPIQYRFLRPAFTPPREPQWRDCGVAGGCLLFDGSSTAVVYPPEAVTLGGNALTISAWIAPRAFEWDDPRAAERGEPHLTAIAGQYDREHCRGALLGFHRFGRLCLQFGAGDAWRTLWAGEARLERCRWNHVAAVFDGDAGRATLYQNGQVAGELTLPAGSRIAPAAGESLMIGKNPHAESIPHGTFNMFAGLMDELRIEARALDGAAIAAMAAADAPKIPYGAIGLETILTGDVHKPQYHGGPWQHWMNEPHAPVYFGGVYHLFFQSNSFGPYWRGIHWGHLVSPDTVRWRPVRDAICPEEHGVAPDGVWSGGATLDKNGVPVLFFCAGDYTFAEKGLISNQNIGVAWPADLTDPELTDWIVSDELAIAQQPGQGRPGEVRDAHVWREDDSWYMLICGGSAEHERGTALFFETDTLEVKGGDIDMNWRYRGPVFEMENQPPVYGTSWELPVMLPLTNRAGTLRRHAFFFLPAPADKADNKIYYFVGDFDRKAGRFTPDPAYGGMPRLLDFGDNVFTGPSAFIDPVTGRACMFSIMQDNRDGWQEGAAGWAHNAGLTRNLILSDDGKDVRVSPDPRLYDLLGEQLLALESADLDAANRALADVSGDLLWLRATLLPEGEGNFGLTVKSGGESDASTFTYEPKAGTIFGETTKPGGAARVQGLRGPLPLEDGALRLEVFIDRSLVEAFFNDDKAVTLRAYPHPDSQRMFFFGEGLRVHDLRVRRVRSIYEPQRQFSE